jgi:hypothetical protein
MLVRPSHEQINEHPRMVTRAQLRDGVAQQPRVGVNCQQGANIVVNEFTKQNSSFPQFHRHLVRRTFELTPPAEASEARWSGASKGPKVNQTAGRSYY